MADHPQADSRKAWYLLHSWAGVVLALLMFVLSATGCVALFEQEIRQWQHTELRHLPAPPSGIPNVDAALAEAQRRGLVKDSATFHLPRDSNALLMRLPEDSEKLALFHPVDGSLIAIKSEGFSRMLRILHSDLLLPFPLGMFSVGLLGVLLMFLVTTGVVTHRRLYRDAHTLRTDRGWRLAWSDLHKLLGTWGMAFFGLMGFSGSVLGLAALILLQTAVVAHRGDKAAAYQHMLGKEHEAAGRPGARAPAASMLAPEIDGEPFTPRFITFNNIGDANATVVVDGARPDMLSNTDRKVFDRAGVLLETPRGAHLGAGWRVYSALMPLHFADYGGAALKFAYLVLGLLACMMPVSGILLWLDRHRRAGSMRPSYLLVRGLSVGVMAGFPLAVGCLFIAERLQPGWMAMPGNPARLLFAVWGAALAVGLLGRARAGSVRLLLALAGLVFVLVAPLNGWLTGDGLLAALARPLQASHLVDAAMLALGLSFIAASRRLRGD